MRHASACARVHSPSHEHEEGRIRESRHKFPIGWISVIHIFVFIIIIDIIIISFILGPREMSSLMAGQRALLLRSVPNLAVLSGRGVSSAEIADARAAKTVVGGSGGGAPASNLDSDRMITRNPDGTYKLNFMVPSDLSEGRK